MFSTTSRTSSMSGRVAESTEEQGDNASVVLTLPELSRNGLNVVKTLDAAMRHGEMQLKM